MGCTWLWVARGCPHGEWEGTGQGTGNGIFHVSSPELSPESSCEFPVPALAGWAVARVLFPLFSNSY